MPAEDLRATIRQQMEHEDNLVNYRINWLLVSQGFLFVAFTQVLTNKDIPNQPFVLFIVSLLGLLLNGLTYSSIRGAIKAIEELETFWETTPALSAAQRSQFPPISYPGSWDRAEVAAYGIPLCTSAAWLALWVYTILIWI